MMYNNEHFAQPPPAHMGIPPVHIDPKSGKKIIDTTTKNHHKQGNVVVWKGECSVEKWIVGWSKFVKKKNNKIK